MAPLETPAPADEEWEQLLGYESAAVFMDRVRAVQPEFQMTRESAAAVAELCRRLEGLPLALELAAARAGVLTPQQMLKRLAAAGGSDTGARFELLRDEGRHVALRHRSLRATLDWSYHLLSREQRRFFARLSVFRGGWTLEAVEAMCATGSRSRPSVLEYLEHLRGCSLVLAEEDVPSGGMRYRLLETLRDTRRTSWMRRSGRSWPVGTADFNGDGRAGRAATVWAGARRLAGAAGAGTEQSASGARLDGGERRDRMGSADGGGLRPVLGDARPFE